MIHKTFLAGCLGLAFAGAANAATMAERIDAMTDAKRSVFLGKLVSHAGQRCERVTRAFRQGALPDRSTFWNLSCGRGLDYALVLRSDEAQTLRVVRCDEILLLGAPAACFKRF